MPTAANPQDATDANSNTDADADAHNTNNSNKEEIPPKVKPPAAASKPTAKAANVNNLSKLLTGATVLSSKKSPSYSTLFRDAFCNGIFYDASTQLVEVNIVFGAGSLVGEVIATLTKDVMDMSVQRRVLASIFSVRRMRKKMDTSFKGDSIHVSAHCMTLDQFKTGTESDTQNSVVYSKDVQLIWLPVKYSGLVVLHEVY